MPGFSPPTSGFVAEDEPTLVDDYAGPAAEEDTFDYPIKKPASIAGSRQGGSEQRMIKVKPQGIFLGLSVLVMFLLVLIPCWNCVGLLWDPVFMYMAGSQTVGWLLACCVVLVFLCYFTLVLFLNRSRPDMRTEQTMLMIAGIFLSTLGIMLILFGRPIQQQAQLASSEFVSGCKMGARTSQLYIAQEELESLRAMPTCATHASIQDCNGFSEYPKMKEAMVLKTMESDYMCSGICQGTNAKGEQVYPPTLFSQANFKVTCDGMAARRIRNFALEIGNQLMAEGCMLVGTAIVVSFGQLLTFCSLSGKQDEAKSGKGYGAML